MNKLEGFYELRRSKLPATPWFRYGSDTQLDENILWTIRSAVAHGDDLNLPRKIGVTASQAHEFAQSLLKKFSDNDMIICYPYFVALKSGVIDVGYNRTVIEAVDKDLWNLVTDNKKNVTIIFEDDDIQFMGDEKFLLHDEMLELIEQIIRIKALFKQHTDSGKSVFLEWSFAKNADINGNPIGEKKLVFYEIRTV